jgi:hypothetical protein
MTSIANTTIAAGGGKSVRSVTVLSMKETVRNTAILWQSIPMIRAK